MAMQDKSQDKSQNKNSRNVSHNFNWLSLVDYANKYKVSISTLRRKIKLEDIPFKLDSGKYYIVDEPMEVIGKEQGNQLPLEKLEVDVEMEKAQAKPEQRKINPVVDGGDSVLVAANRLVDEIKKAYTLILQEKDEQIRQLREEISDLKTLVRVLESERQRKDTKGGLFFD